MHAQLLCANGDNFVCNVQAEDIHTHNCKEYISSTAMGWADKNNSDAKVKCRKEGGRLMRLTSMADIKFLSEAAGQYAWAHPYHMHAVAVEDITFDGDWRSYDVAIDINLWSPYQSFGMGLPTGYDCAMLVDEAAYDPAIDGYRLVEYNCADPMPFICEIPRTVHNTGPAWTYDQQVTCNHWIDSADGRPIMVDQEYFKTFID